VIYFKSKKNIFILLLLIFIISLFNKDKISGSREYVLDTKKDYKVNLEIPFLKHKIHIKLLSNNELCSKYIDKNQIRVIFFKNYNKLNINEINLLSGGEKISIQTRIEKNLKYCQFKIVFIDPYGGMWKQMITIIIPLLLIIYFILKFFSSLRRSPS